MKGGIAGILKAALDTDWNKLNFGIKLFFTYKQKGKTPSKLNVYSIADRMAEGGTKYEFFKILS